MNYAKTFIRDLKFTTTLKKVFVLSCIMGVYSFIPLVDYLDYKYFSIHVTSLNLSNLEAVFGIVIGLILIFRANRSYERWWEARTLWGSLISSSRNLAIKMKSVTNLQHDQLMMTATFIVNFAQALKDQLSNGKNQNQTAENTVANKANTVQLLNDFYKKIKGWRAHDLISIQELWLVDQELRNFMVIVGGCERIKNTLVSASFRVFSREIIFIYLLLLPWFLVSSFSYLVVIVTVLASYLIIGLEEIAYNLEEPFGDTEDHLDMTKMTGIIGASAIEILTQ